MARSLFLSPHQDDETLFGAYTILRYAPIVVTCFESHVQETRGGPSQKQRMYEQEEALGVLGVGLPRQLSASLRDDCPDQLRLDYHLREIDLDYDRVFAPAVELGGHDQHNMVGSLAELIWGDRVTFYTTYVRGSGRTVTDHGVPYEEDWPAIKFKAMSCYISQLKLANTRPWFTCDWDREWYE